MSEGRSRGKIYDNKKTKSSMPKSEEQMKRALHMDTDSSTVSTDPKNPIKPWYSCVQAVCLCQDSYPNSTDQDTK